MFVIQKNHSAVGAAAPAIEGRGADRLGVMNSPLFFELRSFSLVDSSASHSTLSSNASNSPFAESWLGDLRWKERFICKHKHLVDYMLFVSLSLEYAVRPNLN